MDSVTISALAVGTGIAVMHGWPFQPGLVRSRGETPNPDEFTRLTRDLYVAAGEEGFWQGTFLTPRTDTGWIATVSRHWHLDMPDPR